MTIQDLADTLRGQADKLDGNLGDHVHGMRAGLLLAAVQVQRLANESKGANLRDAVTS